MKVFISQPMKNLTTEQIIFNRKQTIKQLEDAGYKIVDSILSNNLYNTKISSLSYLAESLHIIAKEADVVYFMKGWEEVRGCRVEHICCKEYEIPTLYEEELTMSTNEYEKFCVASSIWELIEDEGEANKGYANFLCKYGDKLGPHTIKEIKEIMSEEIKHIATLQKIAEELTGVKIEVH